MKKTASVLVLAFLLGVIPALQLRSQDRKFEDYVDHRLIPNEVKSDHPQQDMPPSWDFTVPVHGPWLSNPDTTSMTVMWITRSSCGAAIDLREKGQTDFKRTWEKTYGQIEFTKDIHTFHLDGLKPGTEYEYRLVSACDKYSRLNTEPVEGKQIYSFRTLDNAKSTYKIFISTDTHGTFRLTLNALFKAGDIGNADFLILLGDNVEDCLRDLPRYYITFGVIDDLVRKGASSRPTAFVRGNHDSNGRLKTAYGTYFPRKDGKAYYCFSHGKVLYMVLDTHSLHSATRLEHLDREEYLKEQAEWIRGLKKTPLWKNSEFRIALAHGGTHGGSDDKRLQAAFKEVLTDNTPEGKIHLYLAGHVHRYCRIDPFSAVTKAGYPSRFESFKAEYPYVMVTGMECEAMTLDVAPGKLTLKSHMWKDGAYTLRDNFSITPDGKVADNITVPVYSERPPRKKK